MNQTTTPATALPVDSSGNSPGSSSPPATPDPEVIAFRENFDRTGPALAARTSPLDELIRQGAQRMLQAAINSEVEDFLAQHALKVDEHGRRLVVRNGHLPARELLTGAGTLEVQEPRVRDNSPDPHSRTRFSPTILPASLRKSPALEELIPWLYLKGVSTGDFSEALQALVGENPNGFSPNVIVRLKEQWSSEYEAWMQRDLSGKQYVYLWADGIHVNVRLEDDANKRQCMLVLMGATSQGEKELIAVVDGYRESEQSWYELLLDLKQRGLTIAPQLAVADGALGFWAAVGKSSQRSRNNAAGCTRPPTCSTSFPRACSPGPKASCTTSGNPPRRPRRMWRSMRSWRSTRRSISPRVNA